MTVVFLLDVWEDLKRKRLVPVAIGLLGVVLALPLLPLGPEDAETPSQVGGAVSADGAMLVRLEDERSPSRSSLNVFEAKNPFKGPARGASALSGESTSVARSSDAASAADDGSPGSGSSGPPSTGQGSPRPASSGPGAAAPVSKPPSPQSAGGGASGGGSDSGGSSVGRDAGDGSQEGSRRTESEAETASYTFTIDLRFGVSERVKTLRGLKRLSALPSVRAPVLVFLGTTATRHSAVFLVDAGVRQQGEGACSPSPDTCTFLYLRLDRNRDTHTLIAADGTTYDLRLLDIERVRTDAQTARPGGSEAAAAGRGAPRPFALGAPALVDEQE